MEEVAALKISLWFENVFIIVLAIKKFGTALAACPDFYPDRNVVLLCMHELLKYLDWRVFIFVGNTFKYYEDYFELRELP